MPSIEFEDDEIVLRIKKPHPQVLPFYPTYDITKPSPLAVEDYTRVDNCVGHTQRSWIVYWSLRAFIESGGMISCDIGSAGVQHPGCLSVDAVGTGEVPEYNGIMNGVQIKAEASRLNLFGSNSFSCVLSNHLIEHLSPCYKYEGWLANHFDGDRAHISPKDALSVKKMLQCDGEELISIIRNQWLRIVRPGGYVGFITPDNDVAVRNGMTSFDYDFSHQHALGGVAFCALLERELKNEVEVIEANTLSNNFSFNWICRKL